jgi:hypothetical protein
MSSSVLLPFSLTGKIDPQAEQAIRLIWNGLNDAHQAILALKSQQSTSTTATTTTATASSGASGGGSISPSSIGVVNQQTTGVYKIVAGDFGALILLESAASFAITLDSTGGAIATPFYTVIDNQCLGNAVLTPVTGLVNDGPSWTIPSGNFALVYFDGTNWWVTPNSNPILPDNTPAISHEWINAYNAFTGVFTQTRPHAYDLADSTTGSGMVVLDSGPTLVSPYITGILDLIGGLEDSFGSTGTAGEVLSSTGSNKVQWIPAIPDSTTGSGAVVLDSGPSLISPTVTGVMKIAGTLWVDGPLEDGSSTDGTAGEVLVSTVSGVKWVPNGITSFNSAVQSQLTVATTDYYVTSSNITVPASPVSGIVVGTVLRWRIQLVKNAAGTGTFSVILYAGTHGSTADTAEVTQSLGSMSGVGDTMTMDITIVFTAVGSSGAFFWTIAPLHEAASGAGFGPTVTSTFNGTVSSFNTTTASLIFGIGFVCGTGGTLPTISVPFVEAVAYNLV